MFSLRPRSVEFKASWETNCESQLKSLFSKEGPSCSALLLYSHIYELCISFPENHSMRLLQHLAQLFFDSAVLIRQRIIESQGDEAFLKFYVLEWLNYCSAFKAINGVCRYLNKCIRANYETAQYPTGSSDISDPSSAGLYFQPVFIKFGAADKSERIELKITCVEDVAISVWNNVILRYFREKHENRLLKVFLSSLRQEQIQENSLKSFIESFKWCSDMSLIEAVECNTNEFYADLSQKYISDHGVSKYVSFATEALSRETDRTKQLWCEDYELILRACELELIEKHKIQLQDEFERMLKSGITSDISSLYHLLRKNEGTTTTLQQSLKHLILKEFDNNSINLGINEIQNVQILLQKFTEFIRHSFNNEPNILATLEDSMSFIINKKITGAGCLFSKYIDESLRNRSLSTDSISLIQVFCENIDAFDDFINDYKEKLAQRLVFHSVNLCDEENVLGVFRSAEKLSPEQNCHLSRILQDFQAKTSEVIVMTSHAWPSTCDPRCSNSEFTPRNPILKNIMQSFEDDYKHVHCGRRLQWCPHLFTLETDNGTVMSLLQYELISEMPFDSVTEIGEKLAASQKDITLALKSLQEHGVVKFNSHDGQITFLQLPDGLNLLPSEDLELAVAETSSEAIVDFIQQEHEMTSARHLRESYILQCMVTLILKRQRQVSPAELRKLLLSSSASLAHGHAFAPKSEDIEIAVTSLIQKGYLEFNVHENIYIYVP